jgi:hypothetical protein
MERPEPSSEHIPMKRPTMNRSIRSACLFLLIALCATLTAPAQNTAPATENTFSFGPPLRRGIVFAYKYTERVRAAQKMFNETVDSSDRTLTYYITQRIVPNEDGSSLLEANIDSMQVEYFGAGGRISFNTQQLQGNEMMVKHREVLASSSLVNRMVNFTLSPYGQIIAMQSEGLQSALQQASNPVVDEFTRERIRALAGNGYLASIYFPWRGVLPIGRKVTYGETIRIPFWSSLDQISFHDTASVTVVPATGATPGPLLRYNATLGNPLNRILTITAFADPVELVGASGTVTGELRLDEDGSVISGWSSSKGIARSKSEGGEITSSFTQEVYVDLIGQMRF